MSPSIFGTCPCCGRVPGEPVFLDGRLACRECISTCNLCRAACLPGDEACSECLRHLHPVSGVAA
jgi:hypothetical protein